PLCQWVERVATWRRVGYLALGIAVCALLFTWRSHWLHEVARAEATTKQVEYADPGSSPDSAWWYGEQDLQSYFDAIGRRGRILSAIPDLTLDVIFPLLYGAFLAALIVRLTPPWLARRGVWLPVTAVAADFGENILLATRAISDTHDSANLAHFAAVC